jgi:hypothetical protein
MPKGSRRFTPKQKKPNFLERMPFNTKPWSPFFIMGCIGYIILMSYSFIYFGFKGMALCFFAFLAFGTRYYPDVIFWGVGKMGKLRRKRRTMTAIKGTKPPQKNQTLWTPRK